LHFKRLANLTCAMLIAGAVFGLSSAAASAAPALQGAGSTLVAPIMAEWAAAWAQATGNPTPVYQSVGSGAGQKDIGESLVDFGASDAPLSSSTTPCNGCFQIPWALTGVGISYNLPGVHKLQLTGPVIAQMYLGQITHWNDRRITSLNKGVHLPSMPITPVHRSDGSGDSYAFTNYESDVSGAFARGIGTAVKPTFPTGPGGNGNSGMVTVVKGTPGSIAYITTAYLIAQHLPAAAIKNNAGRYIYPNLKNISNAASVLRGIPGDNEIHIVNPPRSAKTAYPISTFTYCLLQPTDPLGNGAELKSFIAYAIGPGQSFGPALDYVPIPAKIRSRDLATLNLVH
jgi:phosphate transport system substrate-binding protein